MTGHARFVMMASLGLLASSSTFGQPISETAFTYQGELEQNGIAVSQQCDFAFSLWTGNNAPDPGVQVGPVVELSALVDEGIFTTELDFGASPLDGSARSRGTEARIGFDICTSRIEYLADPETARAGLQAPGGIPPSPRTKVNGLPKLTIAHDIGSSLGLVRPTGGVPALAGPA